MNFKNIIIKFQCYIAFVLAQIILIFHSLILLSFKTNWCSICTSKISDLVTYTQNEFHNLLSYISSLNL